MTTILTQGDPAGQPSSPLVVDRCLHVGIEPSEGSAATSLDTWEQRDIESPLSLEKRSLAALTEVTDSAFMEAVITAYASSGVETLVRQSRRMAECCTTIQINCTASHASMSPNHCDVRACANCNVHRSRKALQRWGSIDKDVKGRGERLRFLTLTMRAVKGRTHGEARALIMKAWRKLWRRKATRHYIHGAIRKLETTWNPDDGWWHVHLHLVFEGRFWPQRELETMWRDCIGGVEVDGVEDGGVHIKGAYDVQELMKYSLKHHKVPADKLVEWAQDMQGAHELDFLGSWRGITHVEVQEEPTEQDLWAFRVACDDEEATSTEVRVLNEDRLTWLAWPDHDEFPDFVRNWARARLREVIGSVDRLELARDKRRYTPN